MMEEKAMSNKPDTQAMSTPFVESASSEEGLVHSPGSEEHTIDVASWGIPSSIVCGEEFSIKIGARCTRGCTLTGHEIQVCDHAGLVIAAATLGELIESVEGPLFCAEPTLQAPTEEGRYRWKVQFVPSELEIPHDEVVSSFAFSVTPQADHVVTVKALEKDTRSPVNNARITLRPHYYRGWNYRGQTDESGTARVCAPKGKYQLYVAGEQNEKLVPSLEVEGDLTIEIELTEPLNSWRVLPR